MNDILEFRAARPAAKPHEAPTRSEDFDPEAFAARWRELERAEALQEQARLLQGELRPFYEKLMRAMLKAGGNPVLSPLNLYLALSALAALATGKTLAQILSLLNAGSEGELRVRATTLLEASAVSDGENLCTLSSSVWLNKRLLDHYKEGTIRLLQKTYMADTFVGSMGTSELDAAAQKWVNEATGGKLKAESAGIKFGRETALALFTALYLKAGWESEFEPRDTRERVFYGEAGRAKVNTMHQTLDTGLFTGTTFEALALPLSAGGTVYLILPGKASSVNEVLEGGEVFGMLAGGGAWEEVCADVYLPRFEARQKTDLIPALEALGVVDAFSASAAEFGNLAKLPEGLSLYVSKAEHAAMFEVKEKGVEGAAYTEFEVGLCLGLPHEPPPRRRVVFRANRPFIYAVLGAGGELLFAGAARNLE